MIHSKTKVSPKILIFVGNILYIKYIVVLKNLKFKHTVERYILKINKTHKNIKVSQYLKINIFLNVDVYWLLLKNEYATV